MTNIKKVTAKVKIKKERFYKEESSFGIYVAEVLEKLDSEDWDGEPYIEYANWGKNIISIKGNMGKLDVDGEYIAVIIHEPNDKYTGNYNAWNVYQELPRDRKSQEKYLSYLMTNKQFEEFLKAYGHENDLLKLFEEDLIDVSKVKGFGEATYSKIKEKILSSTDLSEVILFSEEFGIPFEIMKKYSLTIGSPSLAVRQIKENPYRLIKMDGISFVKADKIAMKLGIEEDSVFRIRACVSFVLQDSASNGHTWLDEKTIKEKLNSLLDISIAKITDELEKAVNDETDPTLKINNRYTNVNFVTSEKYISNQILGLLNDSRPFMVESDWEKLVDKYCKNNGYNLHKNQRDFLLNWNKYQVNLLVGYGGSGKTFIQNVLISILEENHIPDSFSLLAPTGKASKTMKEYTNKPASTIHRALGRGIINNKFMIVDETSMADVFIMKDLLANLGNPNLRLLFVGDDFQIPSVGVGNILYDMINSRVIPTTKLTQIFRQEDGGIKDISYKIRNNERFLTSGQEGRVKFGKDCVFWLAESKYLGNGVLKNYSNILKKYHEDDILVISPTNKGNLGIVSLNNRIQSLVNPHSEGKEEFTVKRGDNEVTFRVGDKVLNKKNHYSKEIISREFAENEEELEADSVDIFNGDTGRIVSVDIAKRKLLINFEGYVVEMEGDEISTLLHGWSITIHSAQGSQAKVVILVLDNSAIFQLNANLIYTGVSRATEIMLVLGQEKVINTALRKFQNMERRSFLKDFLKNGYNGEFELCGLSKEESESIERELKETDETPEVIFNEVNRNKKKKLVKEIEMVYNKEEQSEEIVSKESNTKKYIYL